MVFFTLAYQPIRISKVFNTLGHPVEFIHSGNNAVLQLRLLESLMCLSCLESPLKLKAT